MATFALLTKLASDEARDPRVREEHGKQWMNKVKAWCPGVKWLSHYLVLGPHDFLDLYEAAVASGRKSVCIAESQYQRAISQLSTCLRLERETKTGLIMNQRVTTT